MNPKNKVLGVVVLGTMLGAASASAGVLFTTFGPGYTHVPFGYVVGGLYSNEVVADTFTIDGSATMDQAILALVITRATVR